MQDKTFIISFSDYQVPQFKEVSHSSYKWVKNGTDNKYPDYLLDLLRRSPKHGSIIRNKASYIIGKGFKFKDEGGNEELLNIVNRDGESLRKIGKKCAVDIETYGGFYLQVIWSKTKKIADIYHLDYHKVRSDKDNTEFYFREKGWTEYTKADETVKVYPAFDPKKPIKEQVLYYKEYTPGLDTYSLPEYIAGLNYIEADALVSEHVLNNAKTGFTASKMINFFNGEPESEEAKKKIETGIKEKYSGKRGSKIILSFNSDPTKAPTVLDLGTSDLTKEDFTVVDNLIQQNIFANHQVTSPILFGIKTEGQLGGRSEMRDAYEIFKNTYVDDKQEALEEVFNTLNQYRDCPDVTIIPKEPIGYSLTEYKALGAPEGFLMEKMGINPKDYKETDNEKKQRDQQQQFSEQDDNDVIEVFSQFGEPAGNYDVIKKKKTTDSVVEMLAFSEVEVMASNVLDLISKDKRITAETLAEALKIPIPYAERLINDLIEQGFLKSKWEKVGDDKQPVWEVMNKPDVKPVTTEVYVKYSYEGPQDSRNRDFCAKMIELNRVYSRSEIEQISQRVGYSVWERRGGFYHNPKTNVTTPYCRHTWMQNIVVKKKSTNE